MVLRSHPGARRGHSRRVARPSRRLPRPCPNRYEGRARLSRRPMNGPQWRPIVGTGSWTRSSDRFSSVGAAARRRSCPGRCRVALRRPAGRMCFRVDGSHGLHHKVLELMGVSGQPQSGRRARAAMSRSPFGVPDSARSASLAQRTDVNPRLSQAITVRSLPIRPFSCHLSDAGPPGLCRVPVPTRLEDPRRPRH